MRYFFSLCFCFLVVSQSVDAQHRRRTEALADKLFEQGDYYNAMVFYRKLLNIDSSKASTNFKYAESLRLANYNDKALYYYNKVYKMDRGKEYPGALFWMAQMYKYQYNYSKAKRYFKRTERYYRGNKNTYYYAWVKQEQQACDLANRLYNNPLDVEITNLGEGINTVHSEFAGFQLNDSLLVYSSLRPEHDTTYNDTNYSIRMYRARFQSGGWNTIKNGLEVINSGELHTANGVLNTRGNKFYFTICDSTGCEIYVSLYYDGVWGESKNLGSKINVPGYTSTQPWLAKFDDEEYLLYVSDRPGGMGNMDIWMAQTYSNGEFGEPFNAGEFVNTLGDELTPFFHQKSNTLFFSSNWHKGLGSFDIFKSARKEGVFLTAENLGYPINSSVKDFYFRIHKDSALLTSNRIGSFTNKSKTCCNDLYSLPYKIEVKEQRSPKELAYDSLIRFLPLRLFFHNDQPDPRSSQLSTDKNYMNTFGNYIGLLDRYKKEYTRGLKGEEKLDAEDEIIDFFDLEVKEGAENLQKFTALLHRELENGRSIQLTVKGFASPLSKSDYNSNLTQRRIRSVENYFKEYEEGNLIPFIESGKLVIKQQPFGEDKSSKEVSDNINDKRNSIYSKKAAFERRVEIISVDFQ